ncbi:hypothetical protein B0A49_13093, partial [Cryomyces minteri]
DLPTSLDDRRSFPSYSGETEIYDAWQGQSQFLTAPVPARPLNFNLSLDDPSFEDDVSRRSIEESDNRLSQMLAAQARLKEESAAAGNEDIVISDKTLSESEKREMLQTSLNMAASNGDEEGVKRLLGGNAKTYIDVNAPDAEGTPPLIYASCFGHQEVVSALLDAGANVDKQDRNQWSALIWAMTNRHKNIAKILLDHGASTEVKSSTGRTAFDFVAPHSEISDYLHESGYSIGNAGVSDDFYNTGFSQDRFEEEMAENEMKRRMMMESAINLEVDLGNLGLDEQPESSEETEEGQEFVWDKCLNDQMFVFQETELERILDIIITGMTPQRSPSQKPVPANIIFLSARYAHYHANPELLAALLSTANDKIYSVIDRYQWDMTILAFWMSNATLLLHYLKKDAGLVEVTTAFQLQMAELIHEIYILVVRDAERRMDKVLGAAMLDHETIPGFEDIHFQNEWNFLRKKSTVKEEPIEKRFRPPSPKRRAQVSPRNMTSLLSSTLFVLDLYDIHSVITSQIIAQLLFWLGAEIFNRIMSNKRYLARTKAMQIRMNVSILEDWARVNNRHPEHYESGSMTSIGETIVDAARRHLAPVVQLLQWLQCFSSFGEDHQALVGTLQQLPQLTPQQLTHAVKHYRAEVGEKGLSKSAMKYLIGLQRENADRKAKMRRAIPSSPNLTDVQAPSTPVPSTPSKPFEGKDQSKATDGIDQPSQVAPPTPFAQLVPDPTEDADAPKNILMQPALLLPFSLPTSTDMLVSYGAGFGGLNKERERKYIPTVPPEFLAKLDAGSRGGGNATYGSARWSDEEAQ